MNQPDLFDPPPPAPKCGNCVTRNAFDEEQFGDCARAGRRHKDDEACPNWFGKTELNKPLYGRGRSDRSATQDPKTPTNHSSSGCRATP